MADKQFAVICGTMIFCTTLLSLCLGASVSVPTHYVTHGSSCNATVPCNPESLLLCTAGQCQCESPSNQKYNKETKMCLSGVGGHCSLTTSSDDLPNSDTKRLCIKNAHCVSIVTEGPFSYTECQCDKDFIENSAGECVPGIGMPCNYQPDECNPLGMVVCKNERCACLDKLQVYDHEIKRCVSPAGTQCKYDSMQLGCVKNAICYPFYYWVPPKCICKPGYFQTTSRTCAPERYDAQKVRSEDL